MRQMRVGRPGRPFTLWSEAVQGTSRREALPCPTVLCASGLRGTQESSMIGQCQSPLLAVRPFPELAQNCRALTLCPGISLAPADFL